MTGEPDDSTEGGKPAKGRHGRWWLAATVLLIVVAIAGVVAYVFLRESTTPVDVNEAVSDFRREESSIATARTTDVVDTTVVSTTVVGTTEVPRTPMAPRPGSELPLIGVYTYDTNGGESIAALDGRSHRYPDISTITVTHDGCGWVQRWRPLRERWDATTFCPSRRGMELRMDVNHHEFFGIGDTRQFACEAGALYYPARTNPGRTWTAGCTFDEIAVVRNGTIVGTRQFEVGGAPVTVLEFEVHDDITGQSNGSTDRTVQVVPETGLLVGLELTTDVENDSPIGHVHYHEHYELRLTSLEPRR
jgi:hypothetical protein